MKREDFIFDHMDDEYEDYWFKVVGDTKDELTKKYMEMCMVSVTEYYASLEQMVADYGFRGALQIMAECIFEQLGFDDMEFNAEQKSEGAAIKFIHEWMEG